MRKQKINFEEEQKNTLAFLEKLESIKKSSKQIKDKNKYAVHKVEWTKQYKHLNKVDRNLNKEIQQTCQHLDIFFAKQFEEYQIFGKDDQKSFSQFKEFYQNKVETQNVQLWYQIEGLKTIIEKIQQSGKQIYSQQQVKNIFSQVGEFLNQLTLQASNEIEQIGTIDFPTIEGNQKQLQQSDTFTITGGRIIWDEVKGFDLKKQALLKMKDSQSILREFLKGQQNKLEKDEEAKLISEFEKAMSFLKQRYQLEFEKINLDYQQALNFNHEIFKQSQNFAKMNHIYASYISRGKDRNLYYERLSIQFPNISRKTLQLLTGYIEAKIYKNRKIKACERDFLREKNELLEKAQQQITLQIQTKLQNARREAQKLQRREQCFKLNQQLQVLKKANQIKKQKKRKQKQEKLKQQLQQKQKQQKLWKEHVQEVNKKAQVFITQKQIKKKENEQIRKNQQKKQQEQKQKKIIQSKPKIQVRQSIQQRKIRQKLEQKQRMLNNAKYQEQRIQNAILNYNHRPNVPSDPKRLIEPTESLKQKKVQYDQADKVELVKVHGYSVNQLMSDMRFKISMALQQAGLSGTSYAHQVLKNMSKPKQS